ncbi:hypothetical protein CEXT_124271 [Caerostris extrusa]|uniref:Uncharacterized protein n=1 Tax=Caerostris extrusa TaxID=172846 RepID=A0AAV4M8K4_CAEEX|nr:hypothetical protein CEXT_124271 [Caerostris extrusa]
MALKYKPPLNMKREEPTLKRTVWVRERRVVIGCPLLCFLCSGPSVLRPNSILFHSPSLELFVQREFTVPSSHPPMKQPLEQ